MILKPVASEEEATWLAEMLSLVEEGEFRIARPIRSATGLWVVEGWSAWTKLVGEHDEQDRWGEIIATGTAFHHALESVPKPSFIARRQNVWSLGDRVAWGELAPKQFSKAKHLDRLLASSKPLSLPSQLIHGDLTGNVLFADELPPAVIDFSPYWRPVGFASAIVVADALVWGGADTSILEHVARVDEFPQLLVRALIFRVIADRHYWSGEPPRSDLEDPYLPAVMLAAELV